MTSTEPIFNFPDWKSLAGKTLDGGYELKELIEAEGERATFRVRVLGDYSLKASANFYAVSGAAAAEQIALWQAIRGFQNKANLSVPLGTGTLSVNGVEVLYVVVQNADETLAQGLSERALASSEAAQVLQALARGLAELHSNGLVHGCLSPREVLAVGDEIKLSTESIRRIHSEPIIERQEAEYLAPESGARNLTIAADVWCVGATLAQALTQKPYDPGRREEVSNLPHPFGTLLACCLDPDPDQRCKLGDLERILSSKAPPPKPRPVPPKVTEPAKIATPAREIAAEKIDPVTPPQSIPAKTLTEMPMPAATVRKSASELFSVAPASSTPSRVEEEEKGGAFSGRRGWIYAAAAFVLIFFILWLVRSRQRGVDTPTHATGQDSTAAASARPPDSGGKPGAAWPTKTLTPESKTPPATVSHAAVTPPTKTAEPVPVAGQGRTIWRVVMFTYNREADAERKAQSINAKHASLHAEVFSPSGSGSPYLVVTGGRMTRDEAARARLKAIREGMPRDTYMQNYSR